jgi:CBS domain-containing protein
MRSHERISQSTMNNPVSALLDNKDSQLHTVPLTATAFDAVQKMVEARIGSVLVVDGEALVGIDSTTTVEEVLDVHGGKEFRHLPVVDNGRLVGMVSFRDILRWIAQSSNARAE